MGQLEGKVAVVLGASSRGNMGQAMCRRFVAEGGTVITLGNSASFALEHLRVALTNVVSTQPRDVFYAPGTILRATVDTTHPIGFGLPPAVDVMFVAVQPLNCGVVVPVEKETPPVFPAKAFLNSHLSKMVRPPPYP